MKVKRTGTRGKPEGHPAMCLLAITIILGCSEPQQMTDKEAIEVAFQEIRRCEKDYPGSIDTASIFLRRISRDNLGVIHIGFDDSLMRNDVNVSIWPNGVIKIGTLPFDAEFR